MLEPGDIATYDADDLLKPSEYGMQDLHETDPAEGERKLLRSVLYAAQKISRNLDPKNSYESFVREVMLAVRPGIVTSLFIMDLETDRLVLQAAQGLDLAEDQEFSLSPHDGRMFGYEVLQDKMSHLYSKEQIQPYFSARVQGHHSGALPEEILVVPLVFEGECIGIVNLEHYDTRRPFTDSEMQVAEMLATHAAPHLRMTRLYAQSRLKEQEVINLNRVIQTVNSTLDLDTILKTLRRSLSSIFKFDVIFIQLVERERNQMRVHNVHGNRLTSEHLDKFRKLSLTIEGTDSYANAVLKHVKPEILSEVKRDTPLPPFDKRLYDIMPFQSIAFFPLVVHQEEIGVISFTSQLLPIRLRPPQVEEVQKYVTQVANAIYNAFLFEQSRQAQQELMIKNIAIQSQSEEIRAQNEALSSQSHSILQQTRELESLVKIMQVINQEFELEKILDMLLAEGMLLIPGAQRGVFMAFESNSRTFKIIAQKGHEVHAIESVEMSWKEATQRYTRDADQLSPGIYRLPAEHILQPLPQMAHLPQPKAMLSMAMMVKGAIVGFLVFSSYEDPEAFKETEPIKLQRFLEHAATAFFKARFVRKIQQQKSELENAYQKISDSIGYARRILEAILPSTDEIKLAFPESFVFFRPKDIVSGDFYWFSRKLDRIIMAAVDCTGHGIPGAFMSVLGNTLLNQIVNERGITDPGIILNELDRTVKNMLGQFDDESETFDGMDVALCTYDIAAGLLYFGGANRPMYYVTNGELTEIKGVKRPVGGGQMAEEEPFQSHRVRITKGDSVYISTDGFVDQFGGHPRKRKFLASRFKELLLSLHKADMAEQAVTLENAIDEWRGRIPQLDDVLVIGIRFTGRESSEYEE